MAGASLTELCSLVVLRPLTAPPVYHPAEPTAFSFRGDLVPCPSVALPPCPWPDVLPRQRPISPPAAFTLPLDSLYGMLLLAQQDSVQMSFAGEDILGHLRADRKHWQQQQLLNGVDAGAHRAGDL